MSRRRRSFRRSRRGISPVISTIIIVAVAIAISIAVAFWLGGITAIFTRFEKLEISTAYVDTDTNGWYVYLEVKNTGTTDARITEILVNDKPLSTYTQAKWNYSKSDYPNTSDIDKDPGSIDIALSSGSTVYIGIYLDRAAGFSAGQSVTVTLHTAGGQDYPKTVALP